MQNGDEIDVSRKPLSTIYYGLTPNYLQLNAFPCNGLLFRYSKHKKGVEVLFVKGEIDENIVVLANEAQSKLRIHYFEPRGQLGDFASSISKSAKSCIKQNRLTQLPNMDFTCLSNKISTNVTAAVLSKNNMIYSREVMSTKLGNYTCADPDYDSSPADISFPFTLTRGDRKTLIINTLLERPHAKIWYIEDFVTDKECRILMKHALPRLVR